MRTTVETPRTILRPFTLGDAAESFAWFSDPEVMRYIPHGQDETVEQTAARIGRYLEHEHRYGFSKWVIADRRTGQLIGDSGFYHLPEGRGIELGYRLARSHWGLGLASEVALGWIEVASKFFDDPTIYAFAHPDNKASLKVIEKVGFQYLRNETFYGWDVPFYELNLVKATDSPTVMEDQMIVP